MATKTLVVMGDPQMTTTPEHPRGAMLRAYDKTNGNQVGMILMPAPQSGSPMTYMAGGRQYIVVAITAGITPASTRSCTAAVTGRQLQLSGCQVVRLSGCQYCRVVTIRRLTT
jgi:hypothetical protein